MKWLLLLLAVSFAASSAVIDPEIYRALERNPTATVTISFKKSNPAQVRRRFSSLRSTFTTRSARLNTLYNLLKGHADETQEKVLDFLDKTKKAKSSSLPAAPPQTIQLWMSNELIVKNADRKLIEHLRDFEEIQEIYGDRIIPLQHQKITLQHDLQDDLQQKLQHDLHLGLPQETQWGVGAIHAPEVWAKGQRGQGVVVAGIDTGVRFTHEALRNNYRGEYGWFDPTLGSTEPHDPDGHGTVTLAIICGQTRGIGVAPNATWMACPGCNAFGCSVATLRACGNWVGCPTDPKGENPRCELAPHVVSNSWGAGQGDSFYDDIIQTWNLMNIASFFSSGNSGPECGTHNSPADSPLTVAVGATTIENQVWTHSSVGPSTRNVSLVKPDIAGPGHDILSAWIEDDRAYTVSSGTSEACPHVAGVAALLFGVNSNLKVEEVNELLIQGAQPTVPSNMNCGSIDESRYPNYHVGAGQVDALASFNIVKSKF